MTRTAPKPSRAALANSLQCRGRAMRMLTSGGTDVAGNLKRLLSLDEVAALFCLSKAWVRDHATRRNPRIPVVRLGGRRAILRFRPQDVEQFIADHLQAGVQ